MSDINWRADAVADAMLRLMAALEEQDAVADAMLRLMAALEEQDISFRGINITVEVPRRKKPEKYIGTFFGTVRVNEREV